MRSICRCREGIDNPRIATAVDLQIQCRKGGTATIGGQQIVAQTTRHTDGRAEGGAAVGRVGIEHFVRRRRSSGEHGSRGRCGRLDPGQVECRNVRCRLRDAFEGDIVARSEGSYVDDGDIDLQAVCVGGTLLLAAFHGVEVADDWIVRCGRLVQVDADGHVAARDEVLDGGAVGGVEADWSTILK